MNIECVISPTLPLEQEQATLQIQGMRESIRTAIDALEMVNDTHDVPHEHRTVLAKATSSSGTIIQVIRAHTVIDAQSEHGKVILNTNQGRFIAMQTLYQLEHTLGESFVRISKSQIINLDAVDRVEAGFGGSPYAVLSDGSQAWISRRQWSSFKHALGL